MRDTVDRHLKCTYFVGCKQAVVSSLFLIANISDLYDKSIFSPILFFQVMCLYWLTGVSEHPFLFIFSCECDHIYLCSKSAS